METISRKYDFGDSYYFEIEHRPNDPLPYYARIKFRDGMGARKIAGGYGDSAEDALHSIRNVLLYHADVVANFLRQTDMTHPEGATISGGQRAVP
ncbi:MAG TPA: hypothetical protein VK973_05875 [Arenicellales bacterium]|nr:hypothetical protein [Arenicellales bacterium]